MYRKRALEQDEVPEQFVTKLQSLPVVSSAVGRLGALYMGTKEHNRLFRFTLQTAESGLGLVVSASKPVVAKFEKPIGHLNDIACNQLDKLERDYPIIAKPTEEVLKATSDKCSAAVKPIADRVKPITDRVDSAKNYGISKVTGVKDYTSGKIIGAKDFTVSTLTGAKDYTCMKITGAKDYTFGTLTGAKDYTSAKIGGAKDYTYNKIDGVKSYSIEKLRNAREYGTQRAARAQEIGEEQIDRMVKRQTSKIIRSRVDEALNVAHRYVDFYLPEESDETRRDQLQDEADGKVNLSQVTIYARSLELAEKLRYRMYIRIRRQFKTMKDGSFSTLSNPSSLVPSDVMGYARGRYDVVKDRVGYVWTEINKSPDEDADVPADSEHDFRNRTYERRLLATARHFTHRVKTGLATIEDRYLPIFVVQMIHQANQLATSLFLKLQSQEEGDMKMSSAEVSNSSDSSKDESSTFNDYHGHHGHPSNRGHDQHSITRDESMNSTQDYSSNEDHY